MTKSARKILRAVRLPKSTRHAIKTAPKINAAFNIGSGKEIIFVPRSRQSCPRTRFGTSNQA